jgi:proteasome accessory factor B
MTTKLERLLNLVAALLDTERALSAEEIRHRVEGYGGTADAAFRRSFERDKDELRTMGIPVTVENVPGQDPPVLGYRIRRRDYVGADPDLSPDELAALHLATGLVRLGDADTSSAFWKMGGVPTDDTDPDDARGAPRVAVPGDDNLAPLFSAAAERRTARFRYHDVDREVEPFRVAFTRGHWYVTGYDRVRGGERLYRVDRIHGRVELGPPDAFVVPPDARVEVALRAWELGDGESIEARLRVDADQAVWARHDLGPDAHVATHADGSMEFALHVRNPDAFRSYALTFLDHAVVVSPPALRDDLIAWARSLVGPDGGEEPTVAVAGVVPTRGEEA